ncbi:DHCW motif cupin fold protein [Flavihumibacter rivuli]|uniref:DHCW motif cupin fold protein n=1 Tax=Flavihumibacter rivuli TaxID=2838156 RepID=UPI001BDDDC72|nr:DHCW motif cupin fold protein [Flavihumibacter rivuli]ULQ54909.1 DHCW motif cupin fold protein [Flavihumibacter rivuli]
MQVKDLGIPFQIIDWEKIPGEVHKGEEGSATWRTLQYPGLRIRVVKFSKGYLADHWCQLGHVVYCLEGEFESELEGGEKHILTSGMSYVVSDGLSSHRSYSKNGATVLIMDGDFLKR